MGRTERAVALALFLGGTLAAAAEPPPSCTLKPADLRSERVLRDLRLRVPEGCAPLLEAWTSDRSQVWLVRAAALTTLDARSHPAAYAAFAREFVPVEVARIADGAATFNGDWQPAADLVVFLLERGEAPGAAVERALDGLACQCMRRRGPLLPFALSEETCRRFGLGSPRLTQAEQGSVWAITLTTLDARFLRAVSRALPDVTRRSLLADSLLARGARGARAADGSLRVVRCWGADLEGPGEWCGAVAELGLVAATPDVERVLATAWPGPAVEALVRFGPAGAATLSRFLVLPAARQVREGLRVDAIRACVEGLPEAEREALLSTLGTDPVMAAAAREAVAAP